MHLYAGELRPPWPFCINRDSPQAQGLVLWYPLGIGKTEPELCRGLQLASAGDGLRADPLFGTCRDGQQAGSAANGGQNVITTYPLTLAAWYNPNDLAASPSIAQVYQDADSTNHRFSLVCVAATGVARFTAVGGGAAANANSTGTFSVGTWGHLCGVGDSATSRTAYFNGGQPATNVTSVTPSSIDYIRVTVSNAGRLADFRAYNRSLTASEVAAYFSDPRLSLDLYYPLARRSFFFPRG